MFYLDNESIEGVINPKLSTKGTVRSEWIIRLILTIYCPIVQNLKISSSKTERHWAVNK